MCSKEVYNKPFVYHVQIVIPTACCVFGTIKTSLLTSFIFPLLYLQTNDHALLSQLPIPYLPFHDSPHDVLLYKLRFFLLEIPSISHMKCLKTTIKGNSNSRSHWHDWHLSYSFRLN